MKKYQLHGYATGKVSSTYTRWYAMIDRCHNSKNFSYSYYGGRGIKVCKRWRDSIKNFVEDMGIPPKDKTLDRIDNNKGYSKGNCRWATRIEQKKNQRPKKNLRLFTYKGVTKTIEEWSIKKGMKYITLYARIYRYKVPSSKIFKKVL